MACDTDCLQEPRRDVKSTPLHNSAYFGRNLTVNTSPPSPGIERLEEMVRERAMHILAAPCSHRAMLT